MLGGNEAMDFMGLFFGMLLGVPVGLLIDLSIRKAASVAARR
jgi:hypothetical protein